jgi:hypothetical protein
MKVRPHLINSTSVQKNINPNSYNYLIKVFKFNFQKHAKLNNYSSWDIYQLKN